jgi:glucose/arabinose dehydrogenase
MKMLMAAAVAALMSTAVGVQAWAQPQAAGPGPVIPGSTNLGMGKAEASLPFTMTEVTTFTAPWRIAFLPDARMLVTEKGGKVFVTTQDGQKSEVANVPKVVFKGQGGLLGIYLSPHYAADHMVYLTYSEPQSVGGSSLALATAKLNLTAGKESLDGLKVIWHDGAGGEGGQFGGAIAFAPDGKSLFMTSGDRQRFTPAQDPNQPLGKVLHLTLDGKPAADNPMAGKTGAASVPIIDPPKNTETAKTAPVVRTYTFPGPNLTPSETWASGLRTPYGMAFAPDGKLWEVEHGPRGGDELNLIEKGKNYGWPLVGEAPNYDGVPVPLPTTRPDLQMPVLYWTPIIAPGDMVFYKGKAFPQWNGNILISGMGSKTLNRVIVNGATAKGAERWDMGKRIRDVAVAPDGALWLLEDPPQGPNPQPTALLRVTPK